MRRVLTIAMVLFAARTVGAAEAGFRADEAAPTTFLGVEASTDEADAARVDEAHRHAFLGDVLAILENSHSPIAANTIRALQSGAVHLDTLDRMTVEDCVQLLVENPKPWAGIASAEQCGSNPGLARVPAPVLQRVSGFQNENRIYVNPARSPKDMAATVVHEMNHVVNHSGEHYGTQAEIFAEEYRAYFVAQQFEDAGRPAGGAWLGWMKRWIVEQYGLDRVPPAGQADRPTGNLDNDITLSSGLLSRR